VVALAVKQVLVPLALPTLVAVEVAALEFLVVTVVLVVQV
jgi:hypothetical protein